MNANKNKAKFDSLTSESVSDDREEAASTVQSVDGPSGQLPIHQQEFFVATNLAFSAELAAELNCIGRGFDAERLRLLEMIHRHGLPLRPMPRPPGVRLRDPWANFRDAQRRAGESELIYVEGVAWSGDERPHIHAWCIDSDGNVIDACRRDPTKGFYFGILLKTDGLLFEAVRSRCGRAGSMLEHILQVGDPKIEEVVLLP